ncbi:TPA: glycosyltransferase family 2 protein [Elizabethkingia anophelis]
MTRISTIHNDTIITKTPLVSVIIPVFKVASHVEKCTRSLMEQSYHNIEYIFVNDATPDNSIDIVKNIVDNYPDKKDKVRIISHIENKGLPTARNTGLNVAEGEYIFHCDSDDWVDINMIEVLIQRAIMEKSDIVYCDYYLSFNKNERYMKQPVCSTIEEAVRKILSGQMKFNVWNKLIKRSLYLDNQITFPDGRSMGEDMTIIKLFIKAKNISCIQRAFYHYMQTNPNAYTKQVSVPQLEQIHQNTDDIIHYIKKEGKIDCYKNEIQYFKLNVKLPLLIGSDCYMYDLWRDWYPEANAYIGKNPDFSRRIQLLQYAALKKQDWVIKMYNILFTKIVYGFIYR